MVINLPTNLEKATTHRYGSNSFKLHRCATAWPPSPHARTHARMRAPPVNGG